MTGLLLSVVAAVAVAAASPEPGDRLFAAGDFEGARAAYEQSVAAKADDGAAHLGLGTIALYRNDAATAVTELTKAVALLPASMPAKNRLREAQSRLSTSEFAVQMHGDTTVLPFVSDAALPVIRVSIGAKPVYLFIDTGAAGIDLSEGAVKRLGLHTVSAGKGVFAGGATADVLVTTIPTVSIGKAVVSNVHSNVLPGSMKIGNIDVDGAIGARFFSHFTATIDYGHHQLILRRKAQSTADIAGTRVPMLFVGDHFLFAQARVNGAAAGWYNVDTGGDGFGIQMTKAALDAAGITPSGKTEPFRGGGGDVPVQRFTAQRVEMGITRANVPGFYSGANDQYGIFPFAINGTITDRFFRPGAVTFDFNAMQLIVRP